MAHSDDRKRRRGGPEDMALFEAAMRNVRPRKRRTPAPDAASAPPPPEPRPAAPAPPSVAPAPKRARYAPLEPGATGDADRRTLDRLRRGQLRPEARIDLHGMTQETAHAALAGFVVRAQAEGRRCVLVVTGKGSVGAGGGVLRNAAPGWLNAPRLRPRVVAFAEAAPRDGGAGALYVLLRRLRPGAP
jgi:DNA-nicking Smr family endonuclease